MIDEARARVEFMRGVDLDMCVEFPVAACSIIRTAADLLESLAAELEQVACERNAAIQDFELVSISLCRTCKNYRKPTAKRRKGSCVELPDASVTCVGSCSWFEWRGVKEDSK